MTLNGKALHTKNRLLELDAFRGIAAVLVVLFHFTAQSDIGKFFCVGGTGVDLFFMISGFVIFLTLAKTTTWKSFVINRLSRLLPTYWTCVTITFLLKIFNERLNLLSMLPTYAANLTIFEQNVFKMIELDRSYWTMTVEMIFYILMLLVFQLNQLKNMKWIGLALVAVCFLNGLLVKLNYSGLHVFLNFRIPLIRHFPLFYSGILFYKLKFDKEKYSNYLLLIIAFLVQLYLVDKGGSRVASISHSTYGIMLFAYFVMFFVYVNWGFTVIVNRVTIFFGSISYSLYLIHAYIGQYILLPWLAVNLKMSIWLQVLIAFTIVTCIATLINIYVEKPAMRFIRNRKLKRA